MFVFQIPMYSCIATLALPGGLIVHKTAREFTLINIFNIHIRLMYVTPTVKHMATNSAHVNLLVSSNKLQRKEIT